jgi:hypothetical protein
MFFTAGCWWLTSIILATQEAEIRRLGVQSQTEQIVHEILSRQTLHKNRAGEVTQGDGPEFKPQYCKKLLKTTLFLDSLCHVSLIFLSQVFF